MNQSKKPTPAALVLIAFLILSFVLMFAAPYILGPRGDLLALVIEWLLSMSLCALFTGLLAMLFFAAKSPFRWAFLLAVFFFGSCFLFAAYETFTSTADMLLPFRDRTITITKTYYVHPQTGRGAMPETGGWHVVTSDGDDLVVRDAGDGKHLRPGPYKIQLSHFKNIIMSADPIPIPSPPQSQPR